MRYLIFVEDENSSDGMLSTPVGFRESAYIRDEVLPRMKPLSDEEYIGGPLAILGTAARSSYVLHDLAVLWCVEWGPGLLVIRFSPSGDMQWCSLRSPVPNFGGRPATNEEMEAYDEDEPNPQYTIVFDAWDAQFEADREGWQPASADEQSHWQSAMKHAEELGNPILALSTSDPEAFRRWRSKSERSRIWREE